LTWLGNPRLKAKATKRRLQLNLVRLILYYFRSQRNLDKRCSSETEEQKHQT